MTAPFPATIQQLRIFEAVARHHGYTRAAEALHLTQPAVSAQVRKLEEQAGLALFEVIGKQVHLTEGGRAVHAAARDVLERLEGLRADLEGLRGAVTGTLRVTAVTSANHFVPALLGAFLDRHPAVQPSLRATNRANVLAALAANEGDVFVMGRVPRDLAVRTHTILENRVAVVTHPGHPLAVADRVSLGDIARAHFLLREQGSGTRMAVEGLMQQAGLALTPYMELGSDEAIKQAVMAGLGIGVLPLHSLRVEIAAGLIRPLPVEGFPLIRHWYAVHLAEKKLSRAAEAFLAFVREEGEAVLAESLGPG